ncbi:MAG: radical SAM protein [Lentisphaerae bacterium]|nr:radical SAM protein [Lentisphaerota bacterium]
MKPLYKAWLIQIEITNACTHQCANCTRFVGHHRKPYFMELAMVERAIDSLAGFRGGIGIMGGEPTLHPEFPEICAMLRRKVSVEKCGLWTSGYKWEEYKDIIKDTYKLGVYYNDHSDPEQRHQPVLVAIDEVIDDKNLMWRLIDDCWIQKKWSPSINHKGGFFCEVAAAQDILLDGPGGYPLDPGWWDKTPEQFQDQVKRYCVRCSGALPMLRPSNQERKDLISPANYERLKALNSPKILRGDYEIWDRKLDEEALKHVKRWKPWQYLGFFEKRKKDLKLDEIWLIRGFHGLRRLFNRVRGFFASR